MGDLKEQTLRESVLHFLQSPLRYDAYKHEKLETSCEHENHYMVIFGDDLVVGIGGIGETPELAYDNFIRSWDRLKGFDWIKRNK